MATNGTNGVHSTRTLVPGIYAPIPSFFLPGSEDLGTLLSFFYLDRRKTQLTNDI